MDKVLESVKLLPEQIKEAWDAVQLISLPHEMRSLHEIVVSGMGGSALGGRIVKSYAQPSLPVPFEVVTDYSLPNYVDENSLVIISSYSGNTEETVSVFHEALKRNAMIFVITTGGELEKIATAEQVPAYIFNPKNNPSGQPRMAVGYSIGAIFSLLASMNLLYVSEGEMYGAIASAKSFIETNGSKDYANKVFGKIPVFVTSEHLTGAVHVTKNQLNESAKTFSVQFEIPELNHHLMEGLGNPESTKQLVFLLYQSQLYSKQVQKRYPLTKEVIEKNNVQVEVYELKGDTRMQQVLEALIFGSFLQIHLVELYNADPMSIPWVDYFKERLAS